MSVCPFCDENVSASSTTCPSCRSDLSTAPGFLADVMEDYPKPGRFDGIGRSVMSVGVALFSILCLIALLLPAVQQVREATHRTTCRGNLKIIAMALHNYHQDYGTFPPAYIADENGKPLHSWRVLILPYLEEQALYDAYDFSEPWDGPNNIQLLDQMPNCYGCHSGELHGTTTDYAAIVGEECVFAGEKPISLSEIDDGASSTILIGEVTHAGIPWTQPRDVELDSFAALGDLNGFSSNHMGGCHFAMASGHAEFISEQENAESLRALMTRSGAEAVEAFD